ncbi:sensor histidine kinase [Mangrovibacterium sp.]|uniref:sensor histidine kinase n=1 Tax=Mangrovibacterium sp. TaxID=1961364 RepID=UPI003561A405
MSQFMQFKLHSNNRLTVLLHALGWIIMVFIPRYLINNYGGGNDSHFLNQFYFNASVYGTLFYLNYLWLVPRYFFRENKLKYFLFASTLIVVLYFIMNYVNDTVFFDPEHEKLMDRIMNELNKGEDDIRPPIHQFRVFNYFFTSVLICGFSMGLGLIQKLGQNEKERKELEKEKLKTELAFLKGQVSPHFFFNTLNNIYSLIGIDTDEAQEAVLKLSKLMRYLLYESEDGNSKLSDEINFMNHYIDLMKLRISNKVELQISLPERVPEITIPPLLFIAFIENAFKHGISYRDLSFIHIKMEVNEKNIVFETRNSIGKNTAEGESKYSGIGLENVKKRLSLIYPDSHEMTISRTNDTFKVRLEIDCEKIMV